MSQPSLAWPAANKWSLKGRDWALASRAVRHKFSLISQSQQRSGKAWHLVSIDHISDRPVTSFLPMMLSCRWRFCRDVGPRRDSVGTLFSLLPSRRSSCKKIFEMRWGLVCRAGCVGLGINEWQAETGGVTAPLGESLMGKQCPGNQPGGAHRSSPGATNNNLHIQHRDLPYYSTALSRWPGIILQSGRSRISRDPGKINLDHNPWISSCITGVFWNIFKYRCDESRL